MTTLSILIPSQGRDSLERAVKSCIDAGLKGDDELIIVGDSHGEVSSSQARKITGLIRDAFHGGNFHIDPWFYFPFDAGHHCYGHCPLNYGISKAIGDYIMANDDDDEYCSGAFDRIRARIDELESPAPLLFRFQSWWGPIFWDAPGRAVENHIGGHCAVFPNDERLGRFTCRYQGDFDYIRATLDNWGGDDQAVWVDDVIAIARPAVVEKVPA